jgi:transposase
VALQGHASLGACRVLLANLCYDLSVDGHFRSSDRDTPMLMSPSLQDWLPAKHLGRLIVETVESLDLRAIEDSYKGRGERAYRPKMLIALLIDGYATGGVQLSKIGARMF